MPHSSVMNDLTSLGIGRPATWLLGAPIIGNQGHRSKRNTVDISRRQAQGAPPLSRGMDGVDERLAIFDDEPDINDWVEVFCGAAMAVIGIFQLFSPGDLVHPDVMRWFAAAVVAAGGIWAGHGLKDMAVKEVRHAIAVLQGDKQSGIDHGLIRDVLLNPDAYTQFLLQAYEDAWEDGVITDDELDELKKIQAMLGISDEEAAALSKQASGGEEE